MRVLIHAKGTPPQGYPFTDPRTGIKFGGFSQDFLGRVREIIKHRLANPAIWPQHEPQHFSIEGVSRELTDSICNKHPNYCMETVVQGPPTSSAPSAVKAPSNPACPKCGSTQWKPSFCPSCGGRRLDGYICEQCGTKRKR